MKICPSCGSRYEGNERFCPNDGDELAVYSEDQPGSWSGKTVGDFALGSLLSDGPVGEIYRVEGDPGTVVKLIKPTIGTHRAQSGNFEADLEAAASIDTDDIARCRGFQLESEPRFVAWQHLDGSVPLADLVREGGPIPERAAFLMAARVARSLGVLHAERVFHRNLHPGAVLLAGVNHQALRKDPDSILSAPALVTFWGEAHLVRVKDPIEAHSKNAKGFYGHAEYLAPEQAQGRAADERTDIYALGIVLYEALTGKAPFTSGSFTTTLKRQIYEKPLLPRIARPGLKLERQAEDLVVRMLAKRPEDRFESVADLLEALAEAGFALPAERAKRAPSDESHSTRALSRAEIKEMLAQDGAAPAPDPGPADAETPASEPTDVAAPSGTGDPTAETSEAPAENATARTTADDATDETPARDATDKTPADAQPSDAKEDADAHIAAAAPTGDAAAAPDPESADAPDPDPAEDADDEPKEQEAVGAGTQPDESDTSAEMAAAPEPVPSVVVAPEPVPSVVVAPEPVPSVVVAPDLLAETADAGGDDDSTQDDAENETEDAGGKDAAATSNPGSSRKRSRKKRGRQKSGKTASVPAAEPMAASSAAPAAEPKKPSVPVGGAVTELRGRTPSPLTAPVSGETAPTQTRTIKNGRNGVGNGVSHPADGVELDLHGEEWFADGATTEIEPAATDEETSSPFAGRYNILFAVLLVLLVGFGVGGLYLFSQSTNQAEHKDQDARAAAHERKTEEDRQQLFKQFDDALASGKALPPTDGNAFMVLRQLKLRAGVGSTDAYREREKSFMTAAGTEMQAAQGRGDVERAQGIAQLILSMDPEHAEALRIMALAEEPAAIEEPDAGMVENADDAGTVDDAGAVAMEADAEAVADETADAGAAALAAIDDKGPSPEELAAEKKAQEEAARVAEEEARRQAEDDARRKSDDEARRKAEEDARIKAEAQSSKLAQADAKKAAEAEERKRAAEAAARKKQEEDERKAQAQRKREADAEAKAVAARKAKEDAAAKKAEADRKKADADRKKAEADRKKADAAKGDKNDKREEAQRLMKTASGQSGAAALATYRKVVAIDPGNHRAHFNIGVKLSEQGDFSGALKHLERAVKLQGRSSHYRLRLANAYFKTGDQAKAKAQYQKVLELDPENRAAKAMLSRF